MSTLRVVLLLALAMWLQACFIPKSPAVPIPARFYAISEHKSDTLVIFLPGRGDSIDVFDEAGFIATMKEFNVRANAVAVDAHLGYYYSGQLAERIEADILSPYQLKGYRSFILVGTSLGGYGSLWIKSEYPDQIDSIVLIAPYLGPEEIVDDVERSESIEHWEANLPNDPTKDEFPWIWIRQLTESEGGLERTVTIAFGEEDRFRHGAEIVAELLPADKVFRNPGGHDWNTWLELWRSILGSVSREGELGQPDA